MKKIKSEAINGLFLYSGAVALLALGGTANGKAAITHGLRDQSISRNSTPSLAVCETVESTLTRKKNLDGMFLSYFISAAKGDIYFISDRNYKTTMGSDILTPIPGDVDPVPTPDNRYLTLPGLSFYNTSGLSSGSSSRYDASLSGVYQSMGVLEKSATGATTYRAMTDESGGTYQDIRVSEQGAFMELTGKKSVCPNLPGFQLQMPMISEDGKYLVAYSVDSNSTKIYEINAAEEKCDEVLDLGVRTGKADFDEGNKRLTFHMDSNNSFASDYFSGVSGEMTKDIYVVNFKTSKENEIQGITGFARLSSSVKRGSGTYYPRFDGAGKIVASRDEEGTYSIVEFDPDKADYIPHWTPNMSETANKATAARFALGALWNAVCKHEATDTVTEAAFLTLTFDNDRCKSMIETYWMQHELEVRKKLNEVAHMPTDEVSSLKKEDLLAICPKNKKSDSKVIETGAALAAQKTPSQIFMSSCRDCHVSGASSYLIGGEEKVAPKIDFENIQPHQMYSIRARLQMSRDSTLAMPPASAGSLSEDEVESLQNYMEQKISAFEVSR